MTAPDPPAKASVEAMAMAMASVRTEVWVHRCGATFEATAGEIMQCPGCGAPAFADPRSGDPARVRAQVLAEVDAALRDMRTFDAWHRLKPKPRATTRTFWAQQVHRDYIADYLRDTLTPEEH